LNHINQTFIAQYDYWMCAYVNMYRTLQTVDILKRNEVKYFMGQSIM